MTKNLILEGRKEDFRSKFDSKFDSEQLQEIINKSDELNNKHKFLMWMGQVLPETYNETLLNKLYDILVRFQKSVNGLEKKSIEDYESIKELLDVLDDYENRTRRTVQQMEGADVVYEGDGFVVVAPLTYKASCYYGAGSKWCTASRESDGQYRDKMSKGALFYILNTKARTSNIYYKVALYKTFEGDDSFWDAKDDVFYTGWIFGTEIFQKMKDKIDEYFNKKYDSQIKVFTDEVLKRKELERIERERERRELEEKLNGIAERRADGDWDDENECDRQGKRAWAVLYYIENEMNADILSDEEKLERKELEEELDNLVEDEDSSDEILDRITEIQERLEELNEKYDVYNVVPEGRHYDLESFKVIPGVTNDRYEEFAAGTYEELESSAYKYYEGSEIHNFNESFLSDYIDEDKLKEWFEDDRRDDIEQNPGEYFDDDKRTHSDEQIEEMNELKEELRKTKERIELYNTQQNELDTDDDDWETKYDEFTELISELEDKVSELEDDIELIQDDPQGDFDISEDEIEKMLESVLDDLLWQPMRTIREYGLELSNFIDEDAVIKGAIEADGLGMVSGYDNNYEEYEIGGRKMIAMRIN
jgi:hypothetical protein